MPTELLSSRSGILAESASIPPSLLPYHLTGISCRGAAWTQGDLLIHELAWEPHIRCIQYLFSKEDDVQITDDQPTVMLQFILQNHFEGCWAGMDPCVHRQWTCNMLTLPSYQYTLQGHPGCIYRKVELCYSFRQLATVSPHFALLRRLLEARDLGIPAFLYPEDLPVKPRILCRIGELLQSPCHQLFREQYGAAKSMEILIDTLKDFSDEASLHPTLAGFHPLLKA